MERAVAAILAACILAGCFTPTQGPVEVPTPGTIAPTNMPTTGPPLNGTAARVGLSIFRTLTFEYDGRATARAGAALAGAGSPALPTLDAGYNIDYGFWTTARVLFVNATVTWEADSELTRELKLQLNSGPHTADFQVTGKSPLHVEWNTTELDIAPLGLGVWAVTHVDAIAGGATTTHAQDFHVNGTLFVEEVKPLPPPEALRAMPLHFEGKTKTSPCPGVCVDVEEGEDLHPFAASAQPVELRGTLKRTGERQPCTMELSLDEEGKPAGPMPHAEGEEEISFAFDLRGYPRGISFTLMTSCKVDHSGPLFQGAYLPQEYVIEATLTEAT